MKHKILSIRLIHKIFYENNNETICETRNIKTNTPSSHAKKNWTNRYRHTNTLQQYSMIYAHRHAQIAVITIVRNNGHAHINTLCLS